MRWLPAGQGGLHNAQHARSARQLAGSVREAGRAWVLAGWGEESHETAQCMRTGSIISRLMNLKALCSTAPTCSGCLTTGEQHTRTTHKLAVWRIRALA